jgi:hypothetical protein
VLIIIENILSVLSYVLPSKMVLSTPSAVADTARGGHRGLGESDLGDLDSYAKVLNRVPRRIREVGVRDYGTEPVEGHDVEALDGAEVCAVG